MIPFACRCGKQLRAEAELAGKRVRCPACRETVQVPSAPAPAADRTDRIEVRCPCGKRLLAPAYAAGRRAKCPACGKALAIPGREADGGPGEEPSLLPPAPEMKTCPECQALILAEAETCPQCAEEGKERAAGRPRHRSSRRPSNTCLVLLLALAAAPLIVWWTWFRVGSTDPLSLFPPGAVGIAILDRSGALPSDTFQAIVEGLTGMNTWISEKTARVYTALYAGGREESDLLILQGEYPSDTLSPAVNAKIGDHDAVQMSVPDGSGGSHVQCALFLRRHGVVVAGRRPNVENLLAHIASGGEGMDADAVMIDLMSTRKGDAPLWVGVCVPQAFRDETAGKPILCMYSAVLSLTAEGRYDGRELAIRVRARCQDERGATVIDNGTKGFLQMMVLSVPALRDLDMNAITLSHEQEYATLIYRGEVDPGRVRAWIRR